jgi:hypothetical protein
MSITERIINNHKVYYKLQRQGELISVETIGIVTFKTFRYFAKTFEFILVNDKVINYTEQYNNY